MATPTLKDIVPKDMLATLSALWPQETLDKLVNYSEEERASLINLMTERRNGLLQNTSFDMLNFLRKPADPKEMEAVQKDADAAALYRDMLPIVQTNIRERMPHLADGLLMGTLSRNGSERVALAITQTVRENESFSNRMRFITQANTQLKGSWFDWIVNAAAGLFGIETETVKLAKELGVRKAALDTADQLREMGMPSSEAFKVATAIWDQGRQRQGLPPKDAPFAEFAERTAPARPGVGQSAPAIAPVPMVSLGTAVPYTTGFTDALSAGLAAQAHNNATRQTEQNATAVAHRVSPQVLQDRNFASRGEKLDLIRVDYLQAVRGTGPIEPSSEFGRRAVGQFTQEFYANQQRMQGSATMDDYIRHRLTQVVTNPKLLDDKAFAYPREELNQWMARSGSGYSAEKFPTLAAARPRTVDYLTTAEVKDNRATGAVSDEALRKELAEVHRATGRNRGATPLTEEQIKERVEKDFAQLASTHSMAATEQATNVPRRRPEELQRPQLAGAAPSPLAVNAADQRVQRQRTEFVWGEIAANPALQKAMKDNPTLFNLSDDEKHKLQNGVAGFVKSEPSGIKMPDPAQLEKALRANGSSVASLTLPQDVFDVRTRPTVKEAQLMLNTPLVYNYGLTREEGRAVVEKAIKEAGSGQETIKTVALSLPTAQQAAKAKETASDIVKNDVRDPTLSADLPKTDGYKITGIARPKDTPAATNTAVAATTDQTKKAETAQGGNTAPANDRQAATDASTRKEDTKQPAAAEKVSNTYELETQDRLLVQNDAARKAEEQARQVVGTKQLTSPTTVAVPPPPKVNGAQTVVRQ